MMGPGPGLGRLVSRKGSCLSASNLESFLQSSRADASLHEFQEPVREELLEVDVLMRRFFESPMPMLQGISRHILGVTGKKFRPTLVLLTARQGDYHPGDAVFVASVVELIHTATLVHDDTIDRSALRRGLPTINALFNDLVATILGDFIYTKAFHELLEHGNQTIVQVVARTTYRLSIGELLQLQQKSDLNLTEDQYFQLVEDKTASLMAASTEIGALASGMSEERVARFREFGSLLGRAYQVTDDLFDFISSADVLGKGVQSDLTEGKVTLPLIHALAHARPRDRSRLREMAAKRTLTPEEWSDLLVILEESGAVGYCRERASALTDSALALLQEEPPSPWRGALEQAVAYAVKRNH